MNTTDPNHEEHADGIVEDREKAPPVYFNVLFYGLIIWGVVFMAFYLLSGWSSDAELKEKMAAHKGEPPTQQQAKTPAAPQAPAAPSAPVPAVAVAETDASGEEIYKKHCAGCHGANGKGAFGPDLSAGYKYGKTEMAVLESITAGRPGNMPAFGGKLTTEEIEEVTEFILELK